MNGFRLYGDYRGKPVRFKIYARPESDGTSIFFSASYPNEDIWGTGDMDEFDVGDTKYYFRLFLDRAGWAQKSGISEAEAMAEFVAAIAEFEAGGEWRDFISRVNRFFMEGLTRRLEVIETERPSSSAIR